MIPLPMAILGGVFLILAFGGVLWFGTQLLVDIFDWLFGAIEDAWRRERGE